ncbi:MAG: metallophosphoesterase family protein [Desulfamplus sp.]|nr:metallophosphoesterase family protein [Desulfamplus sp.]
MRLIVTADVHGSYSTWLTIKELLKPDDSIAVAGDLFGTRYPRYGYDDYQPNQILEELSKFSHPFYFVYGNCDRDSFSPGYLDTLKFSFMDWKIFLHHGDRYLRQIPPDVLSSDVNLVIQGHTHVFALEEKICLTSSSESHNQNGDGKKIISLNPGSLSDPRTPFYTYAVVESKKIDIIDIKTAISLKSIEINQSYFN